MAFIKREYPLSFSLDEDIYEAFDNATTRNQDAGNTQASVTNENEIGSLPNNSAGSLTDSNNLKDRDQFLDHRPFQIKTEEQDGAGWAQRDSPTVNAQIGAAISRSLPITPQSMAAQMSNMYSNPLVYQNFQNTSNYQQMFPLDLYERHHQAFASSFLSAYSQANTASISNMPYFLPHSDHSNSKDFNPADSLSNVNNRIREIERQCKNITSSPAVQNETSNRSQAHNVQETLFDSVEKLRKNSEKDELLQARISYDKLKLPNGLSLPQSLPSQLSNIYYSNAKVESGEPNNEPLKKINEAELQYPGYQLNAGSPKSENIINADSDVGKGKYSCEDCSYSCQSSAILKIHERTHSGEKPFSCNFCDYKSGQKNNVAKHILVHMKEKPFRCQYCDYKCAQKNNLVVHERTHTGEKPFVCTFCEYKTVQKPNLVKHMYLHTNEKPYSCDVCEYRCVQKTNLMKHKQKHSTEKPFECSECDYKCTQKANLNKHQILHSKHKPFQCEECSFQCAQKCNLSKHRLTKHGLSSLNDISLKSVSGEKFLEPFNASYLNGAEDVHEADLSGVNLETVDNKESITNHFLNSNRSEVS